MLRFLEGFFVGGLLVGIVAVWIYGNLIHYHRQFVEQYMANQPDKEKGKHASR